MSHQDTIAGRLIICAIVSLAFNDLPPLLPAGELSQDAFIYIMPLLVVYVIRSPEPIVIPTILFYFAAAFAACVLVGVTINLGEVVTASFKDKSGLGRVVTQGMSFAFGTFIALLFYNFTLRNLIEPIVRGARLAILVMAAVGILEVGTWYSIPGLIDAYELISRVIHSDPTFPGLYPTRLRTTAFEVSWAAVMLTFFLPFAVVDIGGRKWVAPFYIAIVAVLILLSQSRTALLIFSFQVLFLAWSYLRLRIDLVVHALAIGSFGAMLLIADGSIYNAATSKLANVIEHGSFNPQDEMSDENVSNITRLASVNAALSMFHQQPLFGVGLGQFGFHYPEHLQADDYRSWEVLEYVDPTKSQWPPSFSLHARLLAETGLIGYAIWMAFILLLLLRSLRRTLLADTDHTSLHRAVTMTLFGWILLGASIDSFRFFGGWIALAIALTPTRWERRPA